MNGRFFNRKTARGAQTLGALALTAALAFAACQSPTDSEDEEYTVTAAAGISNGRIIAAPEKAAPGTEITLVLIPNVYYSLAGAPQVKLADGTVVDLTEKAETEPYTFAMPAANVTVSAGFVLNAAHNDIPLYSAADLAKIGVDPAYPMNGVYKLEADFAVTDWTPIGEFPGKPFTGILRGNNHTVIINSFSAEGLAKKAVGLFGYTAFAEMDNLTVEAELDTVTLGDETDATGIIGFGLVIGNSLNANLKNINVSGEINTVESTSRLAAGGMIGILSSGKIETSHIAIEMNGTTSGYLYIGGIAGYIFAYNTGSNIVPSSGVIISDCSFEGSIEGNSGGLYSDAGGIVGSGALNRATTIKGCQVEGNITAIGGTSRSAAGGIAGYGAGFGDQLFSIEDCSFDAGLITASESIANNYAGGSIGQAPATASVSGCASAGDVAASFDGTTSSTSYGIYAGGISGLNQCAIQYCSASGFVQAKNTGTVTGNGRNRVFAGGISGQNLASITQCYATGDIESLYVGNTVSSQDQVAAGGITGLTGEIGGGSSATGSTSDCYYDGGEIRAEGNYAHAGGITGFVAGNNAKVSKSYARGAIWAEGSDQFTETTTHQGARVYKRDTAGGIAGYNTADTSYIPTVENCVALTGNITVTGPADFYIKSGRIVGSNEGTGSSPNYNASAFFGVLTNNEANSAMTITRIITGGATTGPATVTDAADDPENTTDGLGVSISPPPAKTVYEALEWDFSEVWTMGAAGYPVLAWQK
jgi:hypothetical protein